MSRMPEVGDLVRYRGGVNTRMCYLDAVAEITMILTDHSDDERIYYRMTMLETPNFDGSSMHAVGDNFRDYENLDPGFRRFTIVERFAPPQPPASPAEAEAWLEKVLADND